MPKHEDKTRKIDTLPLHLGLAMTNWLSSHSVWQIANNASANSSASSPPEAPNLKPKAKSPKQKPPQNPSPLPKTLAADQVLESLLALQKGLNPEAPPQKAKKQPLNEQLNENPNLLDEDNGQSAFAAYLDLLSRPDFIQAIQKEAEKRVSTLLSGIADYQEAEYERSVIEGNVIWFKGGAQLIDYTGDIDAPALLCIPSLINKPYILDLYEDHSLIAYFIEQGYRPLILDWGEPTLREQQYDCADYVRHLALEALQHLRSHHEGPLHVLGYCMGGVFALAMAQLAPQSIDSLVLLATPWDYHAQREQLPLDETLIEQYETLIDAQDTVPPAWIQSVFHMVNPWHFQEKFRKFPGMSERERLHFLAVEEWVNDGVPLARRVAKECLIGWPQRNMLAKGNWRVGGRVIDPTQIGCPVLIATPTADRVVPLSCSMPLLDLIPHATHIAPETGHVSMIAGHKARQNCWQPVKKWLDKQN